MAKREKPETDQTKPPGTLAELQPDTDPADLMDVDLATDQAKVVDHPGSLPPEERPRHDVCFIFGVPNLQLGYAVPIGKNERGVEQYDSLVWDSNGRPYTTFNIAEKRDKAIVDALRAHIGKRRGDVLELSGAPSTASVGAFDEGLRELFDGTSAQADPVALKTQNNQKRKFYERWLRKWRSQAGRAPAPSAQ